MLRCDGLARGLNPAGVGFGQSAPFGALAGIAWITVRDQNLAGFRFSAAKLHLEQSATIQ
jgi:hypothetical protein